MELNYITIQGWMISKLNLSGNNLLTYALIFGFTQDGESEFSGSINYVCKWLNCSRPTASKSLSELTQSGLLIKSSIVVNNVTFNRYKIDLLVVKKLYGGSKESLQGGSKESLHNNNNIDINKDSISFKERKNKFLSWFNSQIKINLNREGKFRTLSKQTENNLKKVLEINYSSTELTKAFKNMCKNEWVIENNQATPDHFLRIGNLEKYINQEEKNNNIYTPQLPLN